jgi:hypothetical protein
MGASAAAEEADVALPGGGGSVKRVAVARAGVETRHAPINRLLADRADVPQRCSRRDDDAADLCSLIGGDITPMLDSNCPLGLP